MCAQPVKANADRVCQEVEALECLARLYQEGLPPPLQDGPEARASEPGRGPTTLAPRRGPGLSALRDSRSLPGSRKREAVVGAVLEAFLAHFRYLAEFLCMGSGRKTEQTLRATDFVPSWQPAEDHPLRKQWRRACRLLAPLSPDGASPKGPWPVRKMRNDLVAELKHFCQLLPSGRRPWFEGIGGLPRYL